jgi:hypothetical protein
MCPECARLAKLMAMSLEADEDLAEVVAFKVAKVFGCEDFDDAPVGVLQSARLS